MCIICIKDRGVKFPTYQQVKTMCDNNSDGFSIVVCDGNSKPSIYKTLSKDKFLKHYKKVVHTYNYHTTTMFIHARIKTHGTMRIENCHGWSENGLIFAHNGILDIANRDDLTDSETYFRDIFSPAFKCGGWDKAILTIKAIIGTSKFVFMDKKGNIKHFGNYVEDEGLLFSNTTYKPYRFAYPKILPTHYPSYPSYPMGKSVYSSAWDNLDDDFEF